jgi:hypothetical protein
MRLQFSLQLFFKIFFTLINFLLVVLDIHAEMHAGLLVVLDIHAEMHAGFHAKWLSELSN